MGPPSSKISGQNQTVALSILVDAISLNDATITGTSGSPTSFITSTASSASPLPSTSPVSPTLSGLPLPKSPKTGIIVGTIFGGVIFVSVALAGFFYCRKYLWKNGLPKADHILPFMQGRSLNQSTGTGIFSKRNGRAQNVQTTSNTSPTNIQRMNTSATSSTRSQLWLSRNNRHGQIQIPQDNSRLTVNDRSVPVNDSVVTFNAQPHIGPAQELVEQGAGFQVTEGDLPAQAQAIGNLSTDELVRLLHQRLQTGTYNHWDEEPPPDYYTA
ncbi:hypothetical protein VKT23_005970 [Stygiomarasmius scandens]|uniref:Uncharacterized protein n=1 Tax=Marasmiellus scandens TaxID=2682957 RepID=A0ABR1JTC1_9AGAR